MKTTLAAIVIVALTAPIASQGGGGGGRGFPPPQGRGAVVLPAKTTPLFSCGTDATVAFPVPVSWQSIALAADRRLYVPCPAGSHDDRHREMRDAKLLDEAASNPVGEFRRAAMAAYGRLGRPEFVGAPGVPSVLLRALDDGEPVVRREAASAIADALAGGVVEPDDSGPHPASPELIEFARATIQAHLIEEKDNDVAGMYLETLGRLKYADDVTKDAVENLLVVRASGAPARLLGAAKGLESLIRLSPRRPVQDGTREYLRFLVVNGDTLKPVPTVSGPGTAEAPGDEARLTRARRLAMQSLATLRDDDLETLIRASRDADWQVRRLVATRLDPTREDMAETRARLAADRAFQVRYEVLGVEARAVTSSGDCSRLVNAFDDPSTLVKLRAIELIPRGCKTADEIVARLEDMTADLLSYSKASDWQVPARALVSLCRLNPAKVSAQMMQSAANHSAWQVRVTAATIAGQRKDYQTLLRLMYGEPANVRTAVLEAIGNEKSNEIIAAQIRALADPDFQLIRTAANSLKGTPEAKREDASFALLTRLAELTKQGWDTSRDPRVAILQRLQELLPPELGMRLVDYFDDFDPKVRAAAQAAHRALVGGTVSASTRAVHRYPVQPTEAQLAALPSRATIKLAGLPPIELELLPREAPITVAFFAEIAKSGAYNNTTFHRVVPNFVVQGGSPGANEYSGAYPRYWRDEVSSVPHTRGAVGISSRGRDTGDGQIFIDLVDLPRLDHDYTVFARVLSGLDVVDRILEGARIESITVR